jgi:hypothetical protein
MEKRKIFKLIEENFIVPEQIKEEEKQKENAAKIEALEKKREELLADIETEYQRRTTHNGEP